MMTINQKITDALRLYGLMLPSAVREVLYDIGTELTTLRIEIENLKRGGDGKTN